MSYPLTTQLGGHGKLLSDNTDTVMLKPEPAFNHNQSHDAEAEYDRLRALARQEHDKRSSCLAKVCGIRLDAQEFLLIAQIGPQCI